jgi:uncharacterized cupredoxin-like copper-binding protein
MRMFGSMATSHVVVDDGRYPIFRSLPGHRDAGIEGVLAVR